MMIKSIPIAILSVLLIGLKCFGQNEIKTRAEISDFKSTSDYHDVMSFIDQLKTISKNLRVDTIAKTPEGRTVPLLVIGRPIPVYPEELLNDTRIVVYIQANIHAGEVEGKEAALMFARDILKEKNSPLLDHVILLICPLFNADGNEKISTLNRTDQKGPVNGVGVRYNSQYLDLNRDAMKAESPEVRGLLRNVFNRWDPYIFMDCHTTDGSYHVEPVTFTWMVNPNGDNTLISYLKDKMMPEISERLLSRYKVENCFYGEFNDMLNPEKGWLMDASEPRYMVNYYGLRNRLGILNENYIYADFRSRVMGCYNLLHSLLDYASGHYTEIKELITAADRRTIARGINSAVVDSFATEYKVREAEKKVTIKTFEAELVSDSGPRKIYKKSDRQKTVTIPYFIDYYPVKKTGLPFAYMLMVNDQEITGLLKIHGIALERLSIDDTLEAERFDISELRGASRLSQGHYMNSIKGKYTTEKINFRAGTIVIRMAQPLANVAAYLLEPESGDGLLTWNFFDRYLVPQWGRGYNPYPVCKIMNYTSLKTIPLL
jgi:murein tripeptide amidase MpaA